jgi:hypothetical protein
MSEEKIDCYSKTGDLLNDRCGISQQDILDRKQQEKFDKILNSMSKQPKASEEIISCITCLYAERKNSICASCIEKNKLYWEKAYIYPFKQVEQPKKKKILRL